MITPQWELSSDGRFIHDNDFTYDAMLMATGDFVSSQERITWAQRIVDILNAHNSTEKTTGNLVHIKLNVMRTALENIAGIRPIVNNLLSDRDIALIALERINSYEQRKNLRNLASTHRG